MSVFDDNIKSKTITEIILGYACDIFKEMNPSASAAPGTPFYSWDELYKRIVNQRPYAQTSIIDHYISLGCDRHYERTGHYYRAKFIMWPRDTYMYDCVLALDFEEIEKTSWNERFRR